MTSPLDRVLHPTQFEGPTKFTTLPTQTVDKIKKNATTPNVLNLERLVTNNTIATTVTDFPGGADGQKLSILANDANTTIANNAKIVTNTGANKLLANGKVYR